MGSSRIALLPSEPFLEYAFLRWVLAPAVDEAMVDAVHPQARVAVGGHEYRIDYEIVGAAHRFAVELDGFEFHGSRAASTYDRMRQNDRHAGGHVVVRFSYDAIRLDTARCVAQLQAVLRLDPALRDLLVANPIIERPEMDPDPLHALMPSPRIKSSTMQNYFDQARSHLNLKTLRRCQSEASTALANYFGGGGSGRLASCRSARARRPSAS